MSRSGHGPLILGLSGGTAATRVIADVPEDRRIVVSASTSHDSAAVLVRDGAVLAAVEEERLNRLKHTNRLAELATRACLDEAGVTLDDIDTIAFYTNEKLYDLEVSQHLLRSPGAPAEWRGRAYLASVLSEDLGHPIDASRLMFVEHHVAHATSTYLVSGFPDALVVTLDGQGDGISGTVWVGRGGVLTRLLDLPVSDSLGTFYLQPTKYLAYRMFDEYKVMGLAAYGNPSRYRHAFESWCTLEQDGRFKIQAEGKRRTFAALPPPRRSGDRMTPEWQDVAAATQEALERAAMHLFAHYQKETGLRHLCLAGGVMHNSTLVGKVARSGLFDGVFVQPAASDSGCALGAALAAHRDLAPGIPIAPITHVYWGPGLGGSDRVRDQLDAWQPLVQIRRAADLSAEVADAIANGAVIGWVQGRSEFGPRALGNRSILADPRPAANKDRINELIKHREPYRPFAPAVLAEAAERYFEMPAGTCTDYMTLTVPVRPDARSILGAVTHVDGSARVQTVSRETNPRFWRLIEAFETRTGVPVLLNTSFNHSVEPIVQSVDDAVTCFLTTGLTHLVVDDYIVTKSEAMRDRVWTLVPVIPDYVRVLHSHQREPRGGFVDVHLCEHLLKKSKSRNVSAETCRLLQLADGRRTLAELAGGADATAAPTTDRAAITAEIEALWGERLLRLLPIDTVRHTHEPARRAAPEELALSE